MCVVWSSVAWRGHISSHQLFLCVVFALFRCNALCVIMWGGGLLSAVVTFRTSGTEPKLKYYSELCGSDPDVARYECMRSLCVCVRACVCAATRVNWRCVLREWMFWVPLRSLVVGGWVLQRRTERAGGCGYRRDAAARAAWVGSTQGRVIASRVGQSCTTSVTLERARHTVSSLRHNETPERKQN